MKWLKKIFKVIGVLLVVLIGLLYIFDYEYILKGIRVVYLTGHKTAYIDDTPNFDTRIIKKGNTQSWNFHENYNKAKPTEDLVQTNADYKSLTNSFSMAKSITTALLFKAIDDGYIESLNTKVTSILPEVKGAFAKELTVGDLSSMSSGLDWNYDDNIRDVILGLEVFEKPGQSFKYLSGATQLLGMAIEKTTKQNISDYLSNSFWKPMGMESDALWQLDSEKSGLEKVYCCVTSNARDFGRFGQLWLHNGKWNNQQLIPENLAKLAQEPRFKESPMYGYGLWLSNYRNKKISYMRGILGQYVIWQANFKVEHVLFLDIETVPIHENFDELSEDLQNLYICWVCCYKRR